MVPGIGGSHVQGAADLEGSDDCFGLDVFQDALPGGGCHVGLSENQWRVKIFENLVFLFPLEAQILSLLQGFFTAAKSAAVQNDKPIFLSQ